MEKESNELEAINQLKITDSEITALKIIHKAAMTVLMPSWYYEKKDFKRSPSILDGLDVDRESRYRREGARFIINVGTKMGLRYDTMATGVVYFHRFYMFHSFKTFPRYVTACCCLFLAGKVEETPKKCKDIIRIAKTFLADPQFTQFGDDPKEEVMTLERILLQTIKFDLQVDHPYGHLLKYAKSLKGDKVKLQNMVQMAWTFINDSLCTTLCLQFEPEVIAIALMYLAGKLSKFEVVDWVGRISRHSHWWDMFVEGMSIELLEDICHQVLDLYSTPMSNTPQDSPPATPPTKSTRKSSQPPSPVETSTSPAQTKPKEVMVGQPIPRLEPGELKRKVSQLEPKKELAETKAPRITEGKAIPTIIHSSPKGNSSTHGSDTQPSSPSTPIPVVESTIKNTKHPEALIQKIKKSTSTEAVYKSGISNQPVTTVLPADKIAAKPIPTVTTVPTTSFQVTIPPPSATYSQSAPSFYTSVAHETQPFPNIQQPPPQIYPQQSLQFQHPPPPVTPSGPLPGVHHPSQFNEPSQQFPTLPPPGGVPPFNSHFPPPPRPPPSPSVINNPPLAQLPGLTHPPPPRPQGLPPGAGMIRSGPPLGVSPIRPPRMSGDGLYGPRPPGPDMYNSPRLERGGRMSNDFGPQEYFESDNQGYQRRRESEYDGSYPHEPSYSEYSHGFHRSGQFGQNFERPQRHPPPRRFPLEHPMHRKPGPRPPMGNNMSQQQGAATGIPPVRITGSM